MSKNRLSIFRIFLEIIILIIFVKPMFDLNYFTGVFYVIAILYAFWKRLIFKRKWISWMIIFGTVLSYFIGAYLVPMAFGSYLAGDIISVVIIGFLIIYLWVVARNLKKGKR